MTIKVGDKVPSVNLAHMTAEGPGGLASDDLFGGRKVVMFAVNDAFVMDAWGKAQNADAVHMVADGNGEFAKAAGLELDLTGLGLGVRSQRYAMVVEDGVVTHLHVDEPPTVEGSGAEAILDVL